MQPVPEGSEKKVADRGCGSGGRGAAKRARARGAAEVCLVESNDKAHCDLEGIGCVPGATEEHAHAYAADVVLLSPGIEADIAWTLAFCAPKNAPLMAETELGYRAYGGRIIGITGTNGKTTTTALIEHILKQAGKSAVACGNYGLPLSEVALMEPQPEFAVLEVSSFQMETISQFKPEVAIWLNFAPDHMDRYRKVEDYYEAKRRIFENMDASQQAIVRVGDELPGLVPQRVEFSSVSEAGQLSYADGRIMEGGQSLLNLQGTRMEQAHNAENCMAAILACRAMGLADAAIMAGILNFAPPSHRCEMVAEFDGVLWLNDSKSTNLHSTEAAVRSQTRPVVLIVGGKDKGLSYTPMLPLLHEKGRCSICFGQIATQLEGELSPACPTLRCETVEEAVAIARREAQAGDVVLFSPGTSSFDQFTGYVQRGQCFRDAVLNTLKP